MRDFSAVLSCLSLRFTASFRLTIGYVSTCLCHFYPDTYNNHISTQMTSEIHFFLRVIRIRRVYSLVVTKASLMFLHSSSTDFCSNSHISQFKTCFFLLFWVGLWNFLCWIMILVVSFNVNEYLLFFTYFRVDIRNTF